MVEINPSAQVQPKRQLETILLVGERDAGKRTLIRRYLEREFPKDYVGNLPKNRVQFRVLDADVEVSLEAIKPPGCHGMGDYTTDRDQAEYYPFASAIVICFDISERDSFNRVVERWCPEIRHFLRREWGIRYLADKSLSSHYREQCLGNGKVPYLLLGCKAELRSKGGKDFVTTSEGEGLARRFGAAMYLECSAVTGDGVDEVFQNAVRLALLNVESKKERAWWREWLSFLRY